MGSIKLWAIIIGVSSILGYGTWYITTAEGAKADRKTLKAQVEKDAGTISSQDAEIKKLNGRIKDSNAEKLAQLEVEKARVAEAKQSAEELRIQRDKIAGELAKSRKAWAEAIANDQELRDWADDPVPTAVWDRLRVAAGQSGE